MDVTMLTGAQRAADGGDSRERRLDGPDFDAFLAPAIDRGDDPAADRTRARRDNARVDARDTRADDLRNADRDARRAERQQADDRIERRRADARADARRLEERRVAERRVEERAEQRRADDARQAERSRRDEDVDRTERVAGRETDSADEAERPSTADATERVGDTERDAPSDEEVTRTDVAAEVARRIADASAPDAAPDAVDALAGGLGLSGLSHLLRHDAARPEQGAHTASAFVPEVTPEHVRPQHLDAALDVDVEAGPDTAADEMSRLLKQQKAADTLSRTLGDRQPTDSVRLGGRGPAESEAGVRIVGPGAVPSSFGPSRVGDVSFVRPGATPTALPEGVDESSIMRQISDAMRMRDGKLGRAQTAEIQLHPAELGRVRVRIQMEAGVARVLVHTEHAAISDLMGQNLDQLRRDLVAQGVQVSHLEVRNELDGQHGEQREAPEQQEGDEPDRKAEAERPAIRRPRGRIDLQA